MAFVQADLNETGVLRRVTRVNGREIRRDADIGDDNSEIPRIDNFANNIFDLLDLPSS